MKKIQVHQFYMSDIDDIDIYVAEPLYQFEKSEKGQWVMQHALETPVWHQWFTADSFRTTISIEAKLSDEMATYFELKWGNK